VVSITLCGSVLALSGCGGSQSSTKQLTTLTSIAVTPTNATISVGKNQQFAASGKFSDGSVADITSSVTWSSSDMKLASVNSAGLVSAMDLGRPQITASSGSVRGSTPLIIVTAATPAVARFAYVTTVGSDPNDDSVGTIDTFTVDQSTGQLRQIGTMLSGPVPGFLTIGPQNKFFYLVNGSFSIPAGENTISAFSIDPTNGRLVPVSGSPFPTGHTSVSGLVAEPHGKFLYAMNESNLQVFAIDPSSGALKPVSSVVASGSLAVDPSGQFLYVSGSVSDSATLGFEINSDTGALSALPGSPINAGAQIITVDPTGKFLYGVSGGIIVSFAIDPASGALTTLPSPFNTNPEQFSEGVALDPAGKFLYVSHSDVPTAGSSPTEYILVYAIDSDGGVTRQPLQVPTAHTVPSSMCFDPTGKTLYVTEAGSWVEMFSVGPSGSLSSLGTVTTRDSSTAMALSVGSTAVNYVPKFAYVADASSNDVRAYVINESTGALTSAGMATAANPSSVAVDTFGTFAYVANQVDNTVGIYAIGASTGGLTAVGTVTAGSSPIAVAADLSGRFAYVANQLSNDVSMYTIDPNTGSLTLTGTIAAGTTPVALTISPTGQFLFVANEGSSDVSAYTIDPNTGALFSNGTLLPEPNPPSFPPDLTGRTAIVSDPTGKFLYVGAESGSISIYRAGFITPYFDFVAFVNAASGPITALAVDRSGRFVYVADTNSNVIRVFAINSTDGTLTSSGTTVTDLNPVSIAMESSGRFSYVANKGANTISTYTVASSGSLTPSGTVATGTQPVSVSTTSTIH
jgi:6-phosphogluconolactonase (cycloisomerase 2 family)